MKKVVTALITFVLCISLCACGSPAETNAEANTDIEIPIKCQLQKNEKEVLDDFGEATGSSERWLDAYIPCTEIDGHEDGTVYLKCSPAYDDLFISMQMNLETFSSGAKRWDEVTHVKYKIDEEVFELDVEGYAFCVFLADSFLDENPEDSARIATALFEGKDVTFSLKTNRFRTYAFTLYGEGFKGLVDWATFAS